MTAAPAGALGAARRLDAAALTLTMVAMLAGASLITPLMPQYAARWDLSVSASTLLFAVYVIGIVAALLGLGQLADVVGGRRVILAALVLGDLATVMALLAPDLVWLLAARVLHGVGVGLVPGATAAALNGAGVRSPVVAVLVSVATTSGIAGGLLLGGALAGVGTTSAWLVYLAVLMVATVRAGTDPARRTRLATHRFRVLRRPAVPEQGRRAFAVALVATAVAFAGIAAFAGLGPRMLPTSAPVLAGAGIAAAAYVVSGLAQLGLAGRPGAARAGAVVLAAGMAALGAGVREDSLTLVLVAALLVGLGNGLLFPPTLGVAQRLAPAGRRAGVVSTYYLALYAGVSLPLLGLGALADATSFPTAVQVFAVAVGGSALVLAVLDPARPTRP